MIRKQFLISRSAAERLEQIAQERGLSASEVVRQAIASSDANSSEAMESSALLELVSGRLKEAIESTQQAEHRVTDALSKLSRRSCSGQCSPLNGGYC